MSGITSGSGIFSGINTSQLIDQLLAVDGRQKNVYTKRIAQLQTRQAAYLGLNTQISGLKSAASKFNLSKIFQSAAATSSAADTLTASATAGASPGTYQFLVDRLVSTQQVLSTGFTSGTNAGIGATKFTFQSTQARLDRDSALSSLNGGSGISRGKIVVTDASGASATVDLSRAETVNEVLSAINNAAGIKVKASVDGDRLLVENVAAGSGTLTIADAAGYTTATSLGLAGAAGTAGAGGSITGGQINKVGTLTALSLLNDSLGVQISNAAGTATPDFKITGRSGEVFDIDIGDIYADVVPTGGGPAVLTKTKSAVTDLGGVIQRINEQAKAGGIQKVRAEVSADGVGITLVDLTTPSGPAATLKVEEFGTRSTAKDLGILGTTTGGSLTGGRLVSKLNSTLVRTALGGNALSAGAFNISTRDGTTYGFNFNLLSNSSISDFQNLVSATTDGKVTASLNKNGTGFVFTDTTVGTDAFSISGGAADKLGVTTNADGTVSTGDAGHQYIGKSTLISALNNGRGIGTGKFEIVNSYGERRTINIGSNLQTVGEVIDAIKGNSEDLTVRINDSGDGILIEEKARASGPGGQKLSIKDTSGTVAKSLNLVGTAAGIGAQNKLDGSYKRTITLAATDTLQQIADKINQTGYEVSASVVSDGSLSRPFRLSLAAKTGGTAGAFLLDTGDVDLGFSTIAAAQNSRVFFGSSDPAQALLYSTSSNSITGVAQNLTINLKNSSATPVTVTVTRDNETIKKTIDEFVKAFNSTVDRIDSQSKYDTATNRGGVLLGDSVSQSLRAVLFSTITGPALNVNSQYQFASQVGLTIDKDGNLAFDSSKFDTAFQADPQGVTALLTAKTQTTTTTQTPLEGFNNQVFVNTTGSTLTTSQGIFERFVTLADRYIDSTTGIFTAQNKSIDDQVKAQNTRIDGISSQLDSKRTRLQRQFLAMEQAIGKLQGQQGSIGQIRSITG